MFSFSRSVPSRLTHAGRVLAIGIVAAAATVMPATASAQSWLGTLAGTNEVPPNASTATGWVSMSLSGNFLTVSLSWSGLTGGAPTAGHIHCCTAPGTNTIVAVGFLGLPATTSGTYVNMFDLSDQAVYSSAFRTGAGGTAAGAESALIAGLNSGMAYVNLHNATYPGGEIRANVSTVVTPEPASVVMLACGLFAVGVAVRRKQRLS